MILLRNVSTDLDNWINQGRINSRFLRLKKAAILIKETKLIVAPDTAKVGYLTYDRLSVPNFAPPPLSPATSAPLQPS